MKLSDVVSHAGLAFYAEVALAIFFVAFIVVLYELLRRDSGAHAHEATLPLADDVAESKQS